jgi:hypothetical protein
MTDPLKEVGDERQPRVNKGALYWPTDPAWPCPTCGATAFSGAASETGVTLEQVAEAVREVMMNNLQLPGYSSRVASEVVKKLESTRLSDMGSAQ